MWEFIHQYRNGKWETVPRFNQKKADEYMQSLIPKMEPTKPPTPEEEAEIDEIIKSLEKEGLLKPITKCKH